MVVVEYNRIVVAVVVVVVEYNRIVVAVVVVVVEYNRIVVAVVEYNRIVVAVVLHVGGGGVLGKCNLSSSLASTGDTLSQFFSV